MRAPLQDDLEQANAKEARSCSPEWCVDLVESRHLLSGQMTLRFSEAGREEVYKRNRYAAG